METLIIGEGEGFLDLREVAKTIENSTSFAQLLRKWRLFGEELNLKDDVIVDLQQRLKDETYELSDLPRQILKRWKANQGTKAALQKLCDALEDCGVVDIADALKSKYGKTDSDEGPYFLLHDKRHTLKQLLAENTSEQLIHEILEKYKPSRADQPISLLKDEVSPKRLSEYYISRTFLSNTALDEQIFKDESTREHIFVVKGASMSELGRASGFQMIEKSGHQLDKLTTRLILLESEEDFQKVCKKTSKPVHKIQFMQGRFFWLKSTDKMDIIQKFLRKQSVQSEKTKSCNTFGEDEVVEQISSPGSTSVFTIAESPGMGKTVVLNSLALKVHERSSRAVPIFLVLQEFVKQIFTTKQIFPELDCILKYVTTDYHRKLILQNMLESNLYQFYMFLDGYDEVFKENLDFVDELLLLLLKMQNVKIIVTTRRHLTLRVERILKTIAFEMQPFNELNQIDFLTRYWITKHGGKEGEKLHLFAKNCLTALQTKMTDDERNLAGIPLLCMMLAEVYADRARRAAEIEQHSKESILVEELSFFHLYKSLINLRLTRIPDSHTRQKYLDAHVHRAITLLFPDWLEKFIPLLTPQDDTEENILFSIGLIEKSPFSSVPRFFHRTFAEFLLADFIIDRINRDETCVEFMIQQILGKHGINETLKTGNFSMDETESKLLKQLFRLLEITTEKKSADRYTVFKLKHPVITYFLNMNLQIRFVNTPDALNSLNPRNISAEDVCIAAFTCCCNNLESCFNLMADVISRFNIKDQEDLKDKYIKWLFYLAVRYSNSVSFVQRVFKLTKFVFFANMTNHLQPKNFSVALRLSITDDTPLHVAVRQGKYNIVMYLLTEYGDEVLSFKHLLHACVFVTAGGSESVIEEKLLIIEALTQRNRGWLEEKRFSRTPLLEEFVHVRIAKHLVKFGANINAYSTKYGTVLHTAGDCNTYTDLVRWALRNGFHLVNHKDVDGKTPLMRAIEMCKKVDDEVFQLLYDAGADFNEQDNQGFSVIFYAIQYSNSPQFIEKIVDFGANLNHVDNEGRNAAHYVLFPRNYFGYSDKTLSLKMLKLLKSRGFNRFNEKDYYGRTPIMASEKTRWKDFSFDDEVFNLLQEEGVDFNAQDNHGNSVLLYAIEFSKNFHFIQKLLDLGANPNHKGEDGRNAAHIVLECYKDTILAEKVLKLLKLSGFVGFNDKDLNGNTALKLALKRKVSCNLLKFLREETSECSGQNGNW